MPLDAANNILKKPIIKSGVEQGSRVAVCIELFCKNQDSQLVKVSSGSGFIHTRKGKSFFITNWHVITGRNPSDPSKLINNHPDSPFAFQLHLARKENPNHFVPSDKIPLYADGKPRWFETESPKSGSDEKIDLVAIELNYPTTEDGPLITPIEKFSPNGNDLLNIGRDIVIVGYPFGINGSNPYPIWKRGNIGSEPSLLIDGMPKYYIDTPGRPGMSGAPVFMVSEGIKLPSDMADLIIDNKGSVLDRIASLDVDAIRNAEKSQILHFAGVYSGSVGDKNLDRLQVGVTWHAAIVDRLFTHQQAGTNEYPPATL